MRWVLPNADVCAGETGIAAPALPSGDLACRSLDTEQNEDDAAIHFAPTRKADVTYTISAPSMFGFRIHAKKTGKDTALSQKKSLRLVFRSKTTSVQCALARRVSQLQGNGISCLMATTGRLLY